MNNSQYTYAMDYDDNKWKNDMDKGIQQEIEHYHNEKLESGDVIRLILNLHKGTLEL